MDVNNVERINASIDLLLAMVAEEVAEQEGKEPDEVLPELLASKTAELLYNEESKLWWDGPSAIADAYYKEKNQV
ncbi:MAG: hypothetical protein K6G27_08230 [Lachnospiraceae bacterium]|nr:hypothetical protein [Lachnospiraceae bacterium]